MEHITPRAASLVLHTLTAIFISILPFSPSLFANKNHPNLFDLFFRRSDSTFTFQFDSTNSRDQFAVPLSGNLRARGWDHYRNPSNTNSLQPRYFINPSELTEARILELPFTEQQQLLSELRLQKERAQLAENVRAETVKVLSSDDQTTLRKAGKCPCGRTRADGCHQTTAQATQNLRDAKNICLYIAQDHTAKPEQYELAAIGLHIAKTVTDTPTISKKALLKARNRLQAITNTLLNPQNDAVANEPLTPCAIKRLRELKLSALMPGELVGTQVQAQLVNESFKLMSQAESFFNDYQATNSGVREIADFIHIGGTTLQSMCKTQQLTTSFALSDCLTNILEIFRTELDPAWEPEIGVIIGASVGAIEGVVKACHGLYNIARHPVEAGKAVGKAVESFAGLSAQLCQIMIETDPVKRVDFALSLSDSLIHMGGVAAEGLSQLKAEVESNPGEAMRKIVRLGSEVAFLANLPIPDKIKTPVIATLDKIAERVASGAAKIGASVRNSLAEVAEGFTAGIEMKPQLIAQAVDAGGAEVRFSECAREIAQVEKQVAAAGGAGVEEVAVAAAKNAFKFTEQTMAASIRDALNNNNMNHFIKAKHKLKEFFKKYKIDIENLQDNLTLYPTEKANLIRDLLKAAEGSFPHEGLFKDLPVFVGEFLIHIRGTVINGVVKLGTFFIK